MKPRREEIIGIGVAGSIGFGVIVCLCPLYFLLTEPQPIKNCTLMSLFEMQFYHDGDPASQGSVSDYPNVNGKSEDSLRLILTNAPPRYLDEILEKYGYLPGLRTDDPDDLIMLYLKKPTKMEAYGLLTPYWRALTNPRRWAVLPHYIERGHTDRPIMLSTSDFNRRLQKTLDFLKDHNRQHWENIVKEHTEFLNSIKE